MSLIHPVILCGGSGSRLWPRSRVSCPKPFLPLVGDRTLFQQCLDRINDPSRFAAPIVVAGAMHACLIDEQMIACCEGTLIVEPCARNTAPAIGLAAASLPADAIMLVCPSDHHIADTEAFVAGAAAAANLASEGYLTAFGIEPDAPETGYGYIRKGPPIGAGFLIDRFVEKPDVKTAEAFLQTGKFVWNGGIFAFRAGDFLAQLKLLRPAMADLIWQALEGAQQEDGRLLPARTPFSRIESESVDYAVMENASKTAVVSADMGWSDIGNWDALMRVREADKYGNCVRGCADLIESRNVMVETDGARVSVVGLEDVIVVVDGNEVLVISRKHAQAVGKLPGASAQ